MVWLSSISCTNCDKGKYLPFKLDWEVNNTYCDKCNQYKGKTLTYRFCSSECLKDWVIKFVGHKHIWKEHNFIVGAYEHNKEWFIMKRCNLCLTEKEFKATKKEIKEKQQLITDVLNNANK